MGKYHEVELKNDERYVYAYCDPCFESIPQFLVKEASTQDANIVDGKLDCDGCGKDLTEDAQA